MAKRDFIVKQKPSAIEKENRTTVIGIVAIVAIVLIVASFMKVQQLGPFALDENLYGGATDSFVGVHHVSLASHDARIAHLEMSGIGSRTYYLYPESRLLIVAKGDKYVQSILVEDPQVPGVLIANYEDISDVDVVLNTYSGMLYLGGLSDLPVPPLAATPLTVYDGDLQVAGKEFYLRLVASELLITSPAGTDSISLMRNDGLLEGVWVYDGREHDVVVNVPGRLVTIHNLY